MLVAPYTRRSTESMHNASKRSTQFDVVCRNLGLNNKPWFGITGSLATKIGITLDAAKSQLLQHLIFCHRWINVLGLGTRDQEVLINLTENLLITLFTISSERVCQCAKNIIELVTHRDSYAHNKNRFPDTINHLVTFLQVETVQSSPLNNLHQERDQYIISLFQTYKIRNTDDMQKIADFLTYFKPLLDAEEDLVINANERILFYMIYQCVLTKDRTSKKILEIFHRIRKYANHPVIIKYFEKNITLPPFVIYFLERSNEDETECLNNVLSPIDLLFTRYPTEDKIFLEDILPLVLGSRDLYLTIDNTNDRITQLMESIASWKTNADNSYTQLLPQIQQINSTLDLDEQVSEGELKQIVYLALMNQDIVMKECTPCHGYLLNKILTRLKHAIILFKDTDGKYTIIIKPTVSNRVIKNQSIPDNRGGKGSNKSIKTSGIALKFSTTISIKRIVTFSKTSNDSNPSDIITLDPNYNKIRIVDIKNTHSKHHERIIYYSEYYGVPFNLLTKEQVTTHLESIVLQLCNQFKFTMMDLKMANVLFEIIDSNMKVTIIDCVDSHTFVPKDSLTKSVADIKFNTNNPSVVTELQNKEDIAPTNLQHLFNEHEIRNNAIFGMCLILFELLNNEILITDKRIINGLYTQLYPGFYKDTKRAIPENLSFPPGSTFKLATELNAAYCGELTLEGLGNALNNIFTIRSNDFIPELHKNNPKEVDLPTGKE